MIIDRVDVVKRETALACRDMADRLVVFCFRSAAAHSVVVGVLLLVVVFEVCVDVEVVF